jgi:hypothetical protein
MQCLALVNSFSNITNSKDFNFETPFPAMKAKYFNSIFNRLLALRADHNLGRLFKARNMKFMLTRCDHQRSKSTTHLALPLFIVIFPPLNIVLNDLERLCFITAAHALDTEPHHKQQ